MKYASGKFIDLIQSVTSRWANWDPQTPMKVGSYGTIDKETGEFQSEGNIYDEDTKFGFNGGDVTLQPQQHEDADEKPYVRSCGVVFKILHVSPEVNAGPANDIFKMEFDFENSKHAAILIMHKLKYTTLPNDERITGILSTRPDILKGKAVVTQTISCAAYMMIYLSDTRKERITVTLRANAPAKATSDAGESVSFTWSSEGSSAGHFRTGSNPKATYVPLYKLQIHSLKFWERKFGKQRLDAHPRRVNDTPDYCYKILPMDTTVRKACVSKNLSTAEELLARQINLDQNDHKAYANKSFVLARNHDWNDALCDALQSLNIQPSLSGYISKAIVLCGKMEFSEAQETFDLAFTFPSQSSVRTRRLIILIKAVALFNANQQVEAMQELTALFPNADNVTCRVVEAYFRIQLGIKAFDDKCHDKAIEQFDAAINPGVLSNGGLIQSEFEIFAILFGWDLASSLQEAYQYRCYALLRVGKLVEAHQAYTSMMNTYAKVTKASCQFIEWSTAFKKECIAVCVVNGDAALATSEYDIAIELYSTAINLDVATDTLLENRCKAKLGKMSWEEALIDAQKVTELSPHSYLGFHLKHAALHGAQRYSEAIEAFEVMMSRLDDVRPEMQALLQQYISPSNARAAIQDAIGACMEYIPPRLLNTFTGRLCDREAQISAFHMSPEYNQLLSSVITFQDHNVRMQRIHDVVVAFFSCVMLSHRWQKNEPHLHEVQDKNIYDLDPVEGYMKLRSFCGIVRDSGYHWAWVDSCCIDQKNNVEVQRSVNSMFTWYRHSALTLIYLCDVPPSSQSGAMARSVWITRGWTLQEFIAPEVVLFYHNDWTLYLDDRTPNHKKSDRIMQEFEDATGINRHALTSFSPGMKDSREKLQWASMRVTTVPEDTAYSLFGLFKICLTVIPGEGRHNALGRLLEEIIAHSSDIRCLDWVGKSSEFNSCLPADITSYGTSRSLLSSLPEEEIETLISSLQASRAARQLYRKLDYQPLPRFSQRRLHLPCMTFMASVTQIAPQHSPGKEECFTYVVKAGGIKDLLITTTDKLPRKTSIRKQLLLVRPWDRNFLKQSDTAGPDDGESIMDNHSRESSTSPLGESEDELVDSESDSQALRLLVRLGQPFRALLLLQQDREFRRVASDVEIIVQFKDITSVLELKGVETLEIL